MTEFRFLLLVMAICLASGVKAQFYDSADDIYYYVQCDKYGEIMQDGLVLIFNFDGKKAVVLNQHEIYFDLIKTVKTNIKSNPNYYEDKVETEEYNLNYSSYNTYSMNVECSGYVENANPMFGTSEAIYSRTYTYEFTNSRNDCEQKISGSTVYVAWGRSSNTNSVTKYKKVDKSFFKVGRSRTPNGTMHE